MTAGDRSQCGRDAAEGHVNHLDFCHLREQHGREMRGAAHARRSISQFAWIGFGIIDQILERFDRQTGIDRDELGEIRHHRNESKILGHAVRQIVLDGRQ